MYSADILSYLLWITTVILSPFLSPNFFQIILSIIAIVGLWKTFEKAGENGWKALIPIYHLYVLLKISGLSNKKTTKFMLLLFFVPLIIYTTLMSLAALKSTDVSFNVYIGAAMIAIIAEFAVIAKVMSYLSKAFGKDSLFTVGLTLFFPLFILILGVGNSKYLLKKRRYR